MIYNTNALLSLSRLPFHFWEDLNPTENPLDNPGRSIMSYVVAKCLPFENSEIPSVLNDNLKKIINFADNRNKIIELLSTRCRTTQVVLSNFNGHENLWDIAAENSLRLEQIKRRLNDIVLKTSKMESNDFLINSDLVQIKMDLENLKAELNHFGILYEWE
jgi:hypothetical protein